MIHSTHATVPEVASHYDELDPFYREIWGNHVHHGYFRTGRESVADATRALVDRMTEKVTIIPGMKVCDVGCGYGETSRYLVGRYSCEATSFTISAKQFGFARAQAADSRNPHYVLGDWLENELPDASQELVFAIESTEHMPDFDGFFRQAARVLRPGGHLAVFAWLEPARTRSWQRRFLLQPLCDEGRMHLSTVDEYQDRMRANGLEPLRFDDLSAWVSRTWTLCIRRALKEVLGNPELRRYLRSPGGQNQEFLKTLFRIRAAYAVRAMGYGLFIARKGE